MICVSLMGCVLFAFLAAKSQSQKFSIQFVDLGLNEIFDLVTASTGYFFSYNSDIASDGNKYTLNASDISIEEFLNRLLAGTGLQNQIFEDQIVLTLLISELDNSIQKETFTISGRVLDLANEEAISGANIFLSGTNFGGVSDLDGYYTIDDVPFGAYEVIFSHLSYHMDANETELFSQGVVTINGELEIRTHMLDTLEVTSRRLVGPAERDGYLKII